jgi:hypothetical protein
MFRFDEPIHRPIVLRQMPAETRTHQVTSHRDPVRVLVPDASSFGLPLLLQPCRVTVCHHSQLCANKDTSAPLGSHHRDSRNLMQISRQAVQNARQAVCKLSAIAGLGCMSCTPRGLPGPQALGKRKMRHTGHALNLVNREDATACCCALTSGCSSLKVFCFIATPCAAAPVGEGLAQGRSGTWPRVCSPAALRVSNRCHQSTVHSRASSCFRHHNICARALTRDSSPGVDICFVGFRHDPAGPLAVPASAYC